jgi:hypothetical protein
VEDVTMPARIDHVIIAGASLEALEGAFSRLGFSVVGGGAHPHLGTRNRIIILGDGYIELLAIADPVRVSPALRQRIADGAAWVGYALQSDDIAAEAQAIRARGVDVRGPTAGRLVAPDGSARGWRVATLGSDDLWAAALPLPFLIQHDSLGDTHRRELAGADPIAPHPNGARRLLGVTLRTANFAALRSRYERAFGLAPAATPTAARYPLAGGKEWIALERADGSAADAATTTDAAEMSVRVSAPDLAAVERMARAARFACVTRADTLAVSLPGSGQIAFSASA